MNADLLYLFNLFGIKMCGLACFTTELDRSGFFLLVSKRGGGRGPWRKNNLSSRITESYKEKLQANKRQMKHGLQFSKCY